MDIQDYVSKLKFTFIKPKTPLPRVIIKILRYVHFFGFSFEYFNFRAPKSYHIKNSIRKLNFPKMSTFAIGVIINKLVSDMKDNNVFVNVGVWHGFTFLSGIINNPHKKCIGIDNFSQFGGPRNEFLQRFEKFKSKNHFFYDLDYIEYFQRIHEDPIGFYIYDGEHSYENQLKGLKIAEPFLAKDCIILVDDTNWESPKKGTIDFIRNSDNSYEIIYDQNTNIVGHPTLWNGLMIIRKMD